MADNTSEKETDTKRYERIAKQVMNEYKAGLEVMQPRRDKWRKFLKLYVNQMRDPKKVGDTLVFSTHQTILAALYKDQLDTEWLWREEEDEERAEALNAVWTFDYDEMGKAAHDYGKYWDASFFGIAVEDWSHFDRDALTPIPDLWDPMAIVFDPKAVSINGNRLGRGACRFVYRDVLRTKAEMTADAGFFNVDELDADEAKTTEQRNTEQARADARGLGTPFSDVDTNKYYPLVQGYTWIDDKRYRVEAGNGGKTIVRLTPIKTDYWPLTLSRIYPDPHTLVTPGCPDFTEDKQRARAVLQNAMMDSAKFDVMPEWLFDKNKIRNKRQLGNHQPGKFIEAENLDGNTVVPLQKPTIHQYVDGLMNILDTNAQKALATPDIQQGILFQQKRTATETSEVAANVDTRYSLTASLFSLAEKDAAYMWLDAYKTNFKKGIDKKTVRLIGAFGPKILPVTADTFKFKTDPDVRIESRFVSQATKREQLQFLGQFGVVLTQTPGANMRYFAQKMGRLKMSKDEVDRLIPPTIDEMRAEKENDSLNKNTLKDVHIEATDDHKTHLEIHGKAADTKAKFAHIKAHQQAMMIKRNRPELFAGINTQEPAPNQTPNGTTVPLPVPPTPGNPPTLTA
jgi:hypothetical protein